MGGIQLIIGPMFAGKTSELFRILNRWMLAGRNCVLVKHSSDSRYTDTDDEGPVVVSHDGRKMEAVNLENFSEDLDYQFGSYEVIGIDEGQFVRIITFLSLFEKFFT
jgi:thymidine kinase